MLISQAIAKGIADGRRAPSHSRLASSARASGRGRGTRTGGPSTGGWTAWTRRGVPWTREVLALYAERPGVRAPDLAALLGRETQPFKIDVRKLQELGLTRSLAVGYEISPRGRTYLG